LLVAALLAACPFVGIRSRGVPLADRLASIYRERRGVEPLRGTLDITLYRDDFHARDSSTARAWPEVRASHLPFDVHGTTIILVDDVLYTGRTIRAALNALSDFGRPRAVHLAVLVDRGLRELPIQAEFAGKRIATSPVDHVRVRLTELDGADEVTVERSDA
ncbi:MAG: bifunctional pyr operon transcriptional regulator/uracil phosphoribosyltransferase PyrR, partial [Candidatus Hydrogenedentota bacterium]